MRHKKEDGMKEHCSFGDNRLTATLACGKSMLYLSLLDQQTGFTWGEVPLLVMEVYSKAEFRVDEVHEYRVDQVETVDNGIHVTLGDSFHGVRIGLWLRVVDGELSVSMPGAECYEDKQSTYRLFSVVLLPGMMRADASGKMLLPLNTGMLCDPSNKEKTSDRFLIYGEQSRWELMPTLPVCGVQTPEGGMMGIAVRGAEETECHVATDGKGSGVVGFGMSLRQFWPDPVELRTREIRYCPLAAAADLVHFVAKRVRRHVMEDLGKPTLKQRSGESPEVASLLKSYIIKLFYAVENRGIMMCNTDNSAAITFRRVMTFAEARAGLERMKKAGVDHVHTQSVGFNPGGHDGLWPTRFPIDERLGGEKAFRDLIAFGNSIGYTMNVHDNELSSYMRSPDHDVDLLVHDQWGQPMGLGEWGGGITFVINPFARPQGHIEQEMRRLKDLGLTGAAYLDGMGNPLYRDYHPRHKLTRTGYARATNLLIETARKIHGAAATECGFLYCAIPADCLCTPGAAYHVKQCRPEWPVTALMDERVPVWQLAMHGLVILENQALSWEGIMQSVLFGEHPRDEWSANPGVMPVLNEQRIAMHKANYDISLARFGYLQTEEIMTCEEPADEVRRATFSDGTVVVADFGKMELFVNDEQVERPDCFAE